MKTITLEESFLNSLVNNFYFAQHNLHHRTNLISNFSKLKASTPFSQRLNDWLELWFDRHKSIFVFTENDDFDGKNSKQTLLNHIDKFHKTQKIHIWSGACLNTIYGCSKINLYFRSFHDYIHIYYQLGYDFAGESIIASIQCSMLPSDWVLERELIMIEILGQNQYYVKHKEFLKNQRRFSIDYLTNPNDAITKKQNEL